MFGGLDSIRSLSSGNLSDDRLPRVSRKLRRILLSTLDAVDLPTPVLEAIW